MAASVTNELLRGTQSTIQWHGPNEFTEVMVVKGLTGSAFAALETLAHTTAGVSTLGTEHTSKTSFYLRKVRTVLNSPTEAKIYATYKGYPSYETKFEVFGALNAKTVHYDYDDVEMQITRPAALSDADGPPFYLVDVNKLTPQTVIRMSLIGFAGPTEITAIANSSYYTGYTNTATYLGCDARTLLCTRYSLTDEGSGVGKYSWTKVIELQYDPDTWDETVSYRLNNGKVYHNQDSNSEKTFQIYGTRTFPTSWYSL